MKKILPLVLASFSLLIFLNFPTFKITQVSYSETTKDKYVSSPTPVSSHLKTYKNEDYNLLIEYPKKSLSPQDKVIDCGNFISENEGVMLDNLALIQISDWNQSIGEYLKTMGAQDLYNVSAIVDSGAKQALALNSLKTRWKGEEGPPPLWDVEAIYKKDGKLFLVMDSSFLNEGCMNQAGLGWKIENHLRFY